MQVAAGPTPTPRNSSRVTPPKGVNEDLAVRTYTTRLLGSDPKMVLHGGGNTSVKTTVKDHAGRGCGCDLHQGLGLGHGR